MITKRKPKPLAWYILTSLIALNANSVNVLAEDTVANPLALQALETEQLDLTQLTDEPLIDTSVDQTPAILDPLLDTTIEVPEQRWYQVELLIAERLPETPATSNKYQEQLNRPNALILQGDVTLQDYSFEDNQSFIALPQERRQLNKAAKQLNNSSKYNLLFHQAWPQAFIKNQNTPWIDVASESLVLNRPTLSGSVNVKLQRFLHVNIQLVLQELVPVDGFSEVDSFASLLAEEAKLLGLEAQENNQSANVDNDPLPVDQASANLLIYTMKQSRKMRSRVLHYIDHPRLAVLVRIDPYDPNTGLIIPK